MLAFIAGGGFLNYANLSLTADIFLFLTVLALATGIVFGLWTMRSQVRVGGDAEFLSSQWLSTEGRYLGERVLLRDLSASLVSTPSATMADILESRRHWLTLQQRLIGVAAFLLVIFVPLALF
jgi:hypothetical protein